MSAATERGSLHIWESSLEWAKTLGFFLYQIPVIHSFWAFTELIIPFLVMSACLLSLLLFYLSPQPGLNSYHNPHSSSPCSTVHPIPLGPSFSILSLAGPMDLETRELKLKLFKSIAQLTWIPSLLLLLWTQTSVSPEEKIRWGVQCFPGNQLIAEKGTEGNPAFLAATLSSVKNMGFRVRKTGFKFLLCNVVLLWASLLIFLSFSLLIY